ncbi:MAG: DUF7319 domain-containing protein [Halobacteriota archaeon]
MSDAADEADRNDSADSSTRSGSNAHPDDADLDALREVVEEKYDFENFGPAEMMEMTAEEWDVAFDPDTWITGSELLDRVEADLKSRIATRDVFAMLERVDDDGDDRVIAYSDEGYAIVYPDGSVEGRGTVLRDVKPTVALCSMDEYAPQEPPESYELPSPSAVQEGTGELGNLMLQVIAFGQLVAGLGISLLWLLPGFIDRGNIIAPAMGVIFVVVGVALFTIVANARLSDRFRSEQYRNRLRAVNAAEARRPESLPSDNAGPDGDELDA